MGAPRESEKGRRRGQLDDAPLWAIWVSVTGTRRTGAIRRRLAGRRCGASGERGGRRWARGERKRKGEKGRDGRDVRVAIRREDGWMAWKPAIASRARIWTALDGWRRVQLV